MGTDFIEKRKHAYDKYLDRKRAELATADLFTNQADDVCQSFVADIEGHLHFEIGEALHAEVLGGQLVLTRELRVVGVVGDPPASVLQAVAESCGIATAIVQAFHSLAGTIEVTLC